MTVKEDVHSKFVEDWESRSLKDLSPVEQIQLFESVIRAVERRACVTLSNITLLVILDRILSLGKTNFPVLAEVSLDNNSLCFKALHNNQKFNSDEILIAKRFILTELLRVLGRITANILTLPLQKEILSVTLNEPEKT